MASAFTPLLRATGTRVARPWQAGLIAGAIVVLALAGVIAATMMGKPLLAVAVLPAVAIVPLVVMRHKLAIVAMGVVEAANLSLVLSDHGVPKVHLALLGLATLGIVLRWMAQGVRPRVSMMLWFALAYLAARAVSLLAATDVDSGFESLGDLGKDILYFVVVITLCVWTRGAKLLAMAFAGTTAFLGLLSMIQQFGLGNATDFFGLAVLPPNTDIGLAVPRHSGPYGDPNFWGRQLVVAAPLALALFADRTHGRHRWWWLAAFLSIAGGVYLTGSRGTEVALGVTVVAWALLSGRRYARLLFVAPLLLGLLFAVPGLGSRLMSLGDTSTSGAQQVDPSLQGRIAAQEMALLMVQNNPSIGIGAANFTTVEPEYQRRYGYNTPVLAPHNLYLQQASEGGIVGLAAWLALFGAAAFVAARARFLTRVHPGNDPPGEWYLAGGVISALLAWGVASAFLHMATFRIFLLVVIIGVALDIQARTDLARKLGAKRWHPAMLTATVPPRQPRPPRIRLAAAVATTTLLVIGSIAYLVPGVLFTTQWQSTAPVEVKTRTNSPYSSAYQLNVLSRQSLTNTYLALLANPRFTREAEDTLRLSQDERLRTTVTSKPEGGSAIFSVVVTSPTQQGARQVAKHTRASAADFVKNIRPLYVFEARPKSDKTVPVQQLRTARAGAIGAFGLLLAGVLYVLIRRWDWLTSRS